MNSMFALKIVSFIFLFAFSSALNLADCGSTKQCIRRPDGCSETDASCLVFFYQWNEDQQNFLMGMSGGSGNGNQYVAVAFSPNGKMENSETYFCTGSGFTSGVIEAHRSPPTVDSSLEAQVTLQESQTVNGVAECTFTRQLRVTKTINSSPVVFDFETREYHVLQAFGESPVPSSFSYHGNSNRYPSGPYKFRPTAGSVSSQAPVEPTSTGCGSKGCFQNPSGCQAGSSGCMFASWDYDSSTNTFEFEIIGGSPGQYAAIAFGPTNQMKDADLYYCTESKLTSGAIAARAQAPSSSPTLPPEITDVESATTNSVLRCSFKRAAAVTKQVSSGSVKFDLATTTYYLLYAVGNASSDSISYHRGARTVSSNPIDFRLASQAGGSGINDITLKKAHASLMLVAWLTCASVGVIIARHYKPFWHNKTLFGTKVWFQLHRGLMVSAVILTLLAFVLVFIGVGGFTAIAQPHAIVGIFVTLLAIVNPIMAFFRPHPGTQNRPIFNWAHWFVGSSARILGIVAIFLGVAIEPINLIPDWDTWVLVGFVVFHIVIEVILEVISAISGHIEVYKKTSTATKLSMGSNPSPTPSNPRPQHEGLKYRILVFYTLVNVAILVTFIVYIVKT